MTTGMVTCCNGHQNPEHQHFCGECGYPLPVMCPKGHQNPPRQHFCGECGAALGESVQKHQPPEASSNEDGMSRVPEALSAPQPQHYQDDAQHTSGGDDASGRLKVGDRVQVANSGDRFHGLVGIVHGITNEDHGYTIQVDLEGSFNRTTTRTFRSDQLELIGGAAQQPASQKFPREWNAYAPPQDNSFQQSAGHVPQSQPPLQQYFWQGLSRGAKIGLAVAVGIVLLIIASIIISAEPWHSQRYKQCEAAMENEGYKGDALKKAIQFCVDYR
jgi:hypothetical protein